MLSTFLRGALLVLTCSLASSSSLLSLCGYDRIYNPYSNVTIDIIYDHHVHNPFLKRQDLLEGDIAFIEQCLDPTERRFLQVLKKIDDRGSGAFVDLIWEHGYESLGVDQFIAFSERLVKDRFRNINYIAGDMSRRAFLELLYMPPIRGRRSSTTSYGWCTFDKPMELTEDRILQIFKNSGNRAWDEFSDLYVLVLNQLKSRLAHRYFNGHIFKREDRPGSIAEIAALTDIEMLSHILASSKPHCIVFAGSWHAYHISKFLTERLHCHVIHECFPRSQRVPLEYLDRIEYPYIPGMGTNPLSVRRSRPGSLMAWFADTYRTVTVETTTD
jgi:hypothetical protein